MARMTPVAEMIHATAVAVGGHCVLLRGASGAGKSDVAMRLLAQPPDALSAFGLVPAGPIRLVADDQVMLARDGAAIYATAPKTIKGRLEVRGIGIVAVPVAERAEVALVVDLVARDDVPRLPDESLQASVLGQAIPLRRLHAFDAATPLKILMVLGVHT